jgi:hypothetical protein
MTRRARILQAAALVLLSGCSDHGVSGGLPVETSNGVSVHGVAAPASAARGLYVALSTSGHVGVRGYTGNDRKNGPPACSLQNGGEASDVDVDAGDNVVAVNESYVYVYQGPGLCGSLLGQMDTNGFSVDVASNDPVHGKIFVANIEALDPSGDGNLEVCTLSGGCTATLTNSGVSGFFSVALSKNGDCWGAGRGGGSSAVLVYFKGCTGSGQLAIGYRNSYPGGMDVDRHGNIVAIDEPATGKNGAFWIYKGCKPTCTLLGGPFAAEGASEYGHLNRDSTEFAAGDYQYGQIDVYKYKPTNLTYQYSVNNGLYLKAYPTGAAFAPSSR